MASSGWSLRGEVLENCSCAVVCPGHFGFRNKCTHDYCNAVWAFRTSGGSGDGVDLSGFGVVVVGATPPYMIDGDWKVAIYVDETADDRQARQLESIFTGTEQGPWSILARFVSTRLPTRRVPIRFEESHAGLGRVEIPGILSAEAAPVRGHDKRGVASLINLYNVLYLPRHVIAKGRFRYNDHGLSWEEERDGNHALLTTFDWSVRPDE